MWIFDRSALSAADLWKRYNQILLAPDIWREESFAGAARKCQFRRVTRRSRYFGFTSAGNVAGQAPIENGFIEEIRLFIGNAPRDFPHEHVEEEYRKLQRLAVDYRNMFRSELGPPKQARQNEIFDYNRLRVRVFPAFAGPVWVVISNLDIFPNDWVDEPDTGPAAMAASVAEEIWPTWPQSTDSNEV